MLCLDQCPSHVRICLQQIGYRQQLSTRAITHDDDIYRYIYYYMSSFAVVASFNNQVRIIIICARQVDGPPFPAGKGKICVSSKYPRSGATGERLLLGGDPVPTSFEPSVVSALGDEIASITRLYDEPCTPCIVHSRRGCCPSG